MKKAKGKRQKAKMESLVGARTSIFRALLAGFLVMNLGFAALAQSSSTVQAKKDEAPETAKDDKAKPASNDKTTDTYKLQVPTFKTHVPTF